MNTKPSVLVVVEGGVATTYQTEGVDVVTFDLDDFSQADSLEKLELLMALVDVADIVPPYLKTMYTELTGDNLQ